MPDVLVVLPGNQVADFTKTAAVDLSKKLFGGGGGGGREGGGEEAFSISRLTEGVSSWWSALDASTLSPEAPSRPPAASQVGHFLHPPPGHVPDARLRWLLHKCMDIWGCCMTYPGCVTSGSFSQDVDAPQEGFTARAAPPQAVQLYQQSRQKPMGRLLLFHQAALSDMMGAFETLV